MSPMTVNLPDRYNCNVIGCEQLGIIDMGGTFFCNVHAVSRVNRELERERKQAADSQLCEFGQCSRDATHARDCCENPKRLCDQHYNTLSQLHHMSKMASEHKKLTDATLQRRCGWDATCKNVAPHTRKYGTTVAHFCDRHFADDVCANPTRPCDTCGQPDTGIIEDKALCFACFKKKYKKPTLPGRPKARTIALDFDGVLHRYQGYKNGRIDGPIIGARMAIRRMLERGHKVVVFSTRDSAMIVDWLAKYDFPKLPVTATKSPFWVIVDDRAVTFDGAWTQDLEQRIEDFAPYWLGGAPAEGELPWPEDGTSTFDVRL